jgi:hypothetical protein
MRFCYKYQSSVGENPSLLRTFKSGSVLKKAQATKYVGSAQWKKLNSETKLTVNKIANTRYKALKPVHDFQFLKFNHLNVKVDTKVSHPFTKNCLIKSTIL